MFLPTDSAKYRSPMPQNTAIREADWLVLASFWHPVAFAHDVLEAPITAKLLDVDLVLYRTSSGVTVARDICPHRGTRLSSGKVVDDMLVCPMHGLHYDGQGQCRRIPSIAEPTAHIPPSFRLATVKSEIRYGIVWACLSGKPVWQLPHWDGIENPELKKVYFAIDTWKTSAGRHVENFNDLAHFPWVHTGSFGGDTSVPVPPYEVQHTDYGLTFLVPYTEGFNRFDDGVPGDTRDVVYRYELTFPFTTLLKIAPKGTNYVQYFADVASPASAHETRIFQLFTDTTGDPDVAFWQRDQRTINGEDIALVEGQFPQELPLDTRDEMHIPADRMSIEYRRALAGKFGLGVPLSS
jgi:phenylpropionate dioxygenase-like ring-hydroxylating dioxygenase large terminal subunit